MTCPFCFGLGLGSCAFLSGCWNRPRDGEQLVDAQGVVFDTKNRTWSREREDEMLATILYYTQKKAPPSETG
jgi:hypothetical protein